MKDACGPAVVAAGLTKRFRSIPALDRLDLSVEHGQTLAIFGPNGAGKTTLLRILTLGLRPDAGTFVLDGLDPRRDDREIRARIGLVSHSSFLYDPLTAVENLTFFASLYGVPQPALRSRALLESLGLGHRADDPVRTLSRGMQQRVSLARALVHDPAILFLDEPFTGLDREAAASFRATIEDLRSRRRTIVLVTHDTSQGLELSDRWILLAQGRLAAAGRSEDGAPPELERRPSRHRSGSMEDRA